METSVSLFFLPLTLFSFFSFTFSTPIFSPQTNFLINCGSSSNSNTTFYNRIFSPDSNYLSTNQPISVTDSNPSPFSPNLYHSARIFTTDSTYRFNIKKFGTHFVRFHFSPFKVNSYDLNYANFSVVVNGVLALSCFSVHHNIVVKEFILMVDSENFEILFRPVGIGKSNIGFVNAIEVFSASDDLITDNGAKLITDKGIYEFKNLSSQVLETVHRINVGGSKLTPFNDSLWRNWINDDSFLVLKSSAKRAVTTHTPNYQNGGPTREIAPDNVYMTAQEMNRDNLSTIDKFNLTWEFPLDSKGFRYLVRLHFCDMVSPALNILYFNVYINGFLAYKDLDLSSLTYHLLASPYYADFVVDTDETSSAMRISVGPSDLSTSLRVNAILNGVEIMKMVIFSSHSPIAPIKTNIWILLGSCVGGFLLLCLAGLIVSFVTKYRTRKLKPKPKRTESVGWTPLRVYGGGGGSSLSRMSEGTEHLGLKVPFSDIKLATNNFDNNLIIGSGGFGTVYKGVLRERKVAVKRGVAGSRQGLPEFQTEITVLSKIRHLHLVSLVGYCEEQSEMLLVYEYMEKGPLKDHLYGSELAPLSWKQRLDICIGSARGLHYLHTGSVQGIIHRDIKSTNILLDENYVAKVADFGLSRSGPCINETHVSTGVKGSFGYLDPEYFRMQQLTDKSDVYSFGVVLLEVLCARPAVDPALPREQVNLAEWAMQWKKKGLLEQIIDPYLVGEIKPSSLKKFSETAEKCLAEYGVDRPTIGDVLWNLEYALQLHETGRERESHENNETSSRVFSRVPYINAQADEEETSCREISTTEIFSQLLNRRGR